MIFPGIKESERAVFRRDNLGFVFQEFNLLDTFSLQDNIFLPLVLAGMDYKTMNSRLQPIAEKLEITQLLRNFRMRYQGDRSSVRQ